MLLKSFHRTKLRYRTAKIMTEALLFVKVPISVLQGVRSTLKKMWFSLSLEHCTAHTHCEKYSIIEYSKVFRLILPVSETG